MGLLDKAGGVGDDNKKIAKAVPKAAVVESVKAKPVMAKAVKAKAVKAQPAKAAKAKTTRAKRARPVGLTDEYEVASDLNRRISWLVNFLVNFGVLFAAIFISLSDTGIVTTILYATGLGVIIINVIIIPMKFNRNLGQFVSRTKFVKGDGSNPFFIHGLFVNSIGILALVGFIMIFTQFSNLSETDNTIPIVMVSSGALFVILWFIDRFLRNGSEMNQGIFDLMFTAYLVKYTPTEDEKASGIWARLENMGNFGDQLMKKTEERRAKKSSSKANDATPNESADEA